MPWDNYLLDTTFKNRINTLGQKTAAFSTPVVLASDQPAIDVNLVGGSFDITIGTVNQGTPGDTAWPVRVTTMPTTVAQEATLALVRDYTSRIPPLGQALEAASIPVVLTAAQLGVLTPPVAITGYATELTLAALNAKVTACNTTGQATEAKQLPDGHAVAVNNFPAVQYNHDEALYAQIIRALEQLTTPVWYDYATNSIKAVTTGTSTVSGTVTATVANATIASIGGIAADPCVPANINTLWATSIRSLLI